MSFVRRIPVGRSAGTIAILSLLVAGCGSSGGAARQQLALFLNRNAGTISQYLRRADGALQALPTATVSTGALPTAMAVDPSGRYVYVVNSGDNTVSQFGIGPNGLTPLSPATVATRANPVDIIVHPNGRDVYVANAGDNTISLYQISTRGPGGLQVNIRAEFITVDGSALKQLGIDFTGEHLFALNKGANTVVSHQINATTGVPTPVGAPASLPATPDKMAFNPQGPSFYITSKPVELVFHAIISPNGTITLQPTPQVATGPDPVDVAVDPTGRTIFVLNAGDSTVTHAYMDNGIMKALDSVRPQVLAAPRIMTTVQTVQGNAVVIGGLTQSDEHRMDKTNVPGLGDIPILGQLFRSSTKDPAADDLLIFVTPQLINTAN